MTDLRARYEIVKRLVYRRSLTDPKWPKINKAVDRGKAEGRMKNEE
jgi:hypothetical protein